MTRPLEHPDGLSDEALLASMAVGADEAAVTFVRRYQGRIFGLAVRLLGDRALAEDVAQEALVRVWRHSQVYDPRRGSVASWVLTITRNLAVDRLRMERALPTDPDEFVALGLATREQAPEDAALHSDAIARARRALVELPLEQRRALVLAAFYGRTAKEIAVSESIPLGTAKTRIRAGLQRVRAGMLAEEASS